MRQQQWFNQTLRDTPAEADTASHRLMLRAGLIRQLSSGIYSYLPLGVKVLQRIQSIVREEMNAAGAQEVLLPALHPAELWQESGRWDVYGPELMRLEDRNGRAFALGATHEEVITALVRDEIQSYKKLPVTLYQIQTKFRDERRPRFGLLRGREFVMKDAYSFDRSATELDESYKRMFDAYVRIFQRCGLQFRAVEADSGAIGGTDTHEFMALADIGEDMIAHCPACQYAANVEKAVSNPAAVISPQHAPEHSSQSSDLLKIATPGISTIRQLSEHLHIAPSRIIKAVALKADGKALVVLIRGDYELNTVKLAAYLGAASVEMLSAEEIEAVLGSVPGFVGPLGLPDTLIVADGSIHGMQDAVVGANEKDAHLLGVNVCRDLPNVPHADLRVVQEGDTCVHCGAALAFAKGIEVGHVFKLGTKYSDSLGASFVDEQGISKPMVMGCYGIGVSRLLAAVVEQNHDEHGIVWPDSLAPFAIHLITINPQDAAQGKQSADLYHTLRQKGYEVLWDDREERPGVKFKDSDLLGIPLRITVGKKASEGIVECKVRSSGDSYEFQADDLPKHIQSYFQSGGFIHE